MSGAHLLMLAAAAASEGSGGRGSRGGDDFGCAGCFFMLMAVGLLVAVICWF